MFPSLRTLYVSMSPLLWAFQEQNRRVTVTQFRWSWKDGMGAASSSVLISLHAPCFPPARALKPFLCLCRVYTCSLELGNTKRLQILMLKWERQRMQHLHSTFARTTWIPFWFRVSSVEASCRSVTESWAWASAFWQVSRVTFTCAEVWEPPLCGSCVIVRVPRSLAWISEGVRSHSRLSELPFPLQILHRCPHVHALPFQTPTNKQNVIKVSLILPINMEW